MDVKLKKKYFVSISIAALSGTLITGLFLLFPSFYESLENKTLDMRFQLRGPIPQRQDIVFVEMDQPSIEALGRWPWPRDIFARIVETLSELKAKAILFDVTFTEPSQLIVDKDRLDEQLRLKENKKLLDDFIADAQISLGKSKDPAAEAGAALTQIKEGLGVWEKDIEETLQASLKDNDQILAQAISGAGNVYGGCHFEVIHTPLDILRDSFDREPIRKWISQNPAGGFAQLPRNLLDIPGFSLDELRTLFIRGKLYVLFNKNLELPLKDAEAALKDTPVEFLRPHYNDVKRLLFREKLSLLLDNPVELSFKELVWKLGLFEPRDIQVLNQQYLELTQEKTFARKQGIAYSGLKGFYKAIKMFPPIRLLADSFKYCGFLNAIPDSDGVLRKAPLLVRYQDKIYPHITLRLIFDLLGLDPQKDMRIIPGKRIFIGDIAVPVDSNATMLLNWTDKWLDSFRHVSAGQVYRLWDMRQSMENNSRMSQEELSQNNREDSLAQEKEKLAELEAKLRPEIANNICIIGLTAAGTHDLTPIPIESEYPAVGTHATIINTILEKRFLQRVEKKVAVGLIFLLGIITALCITSLSPGLSLIFIFAVTLLYAAAALAAFAWKGSWVDLVGPIGSALLSYIGISSYHFATEAKEKRWIRKAFGHYISKNVMEEILKHPDKLKLGGERKELTVLFADVRNFTTYSEKRQPEEVVAILNEYLDEMTKIIFIHGGTLDKYVGDQIMAIFGAPATSPQKDHAQKAVMVALEMISRMSQLKEEWMKLGKEPLDIGIGINTGTMLVGNMGSTERMDYTVIGDAVNLAERTETLTRHYNNHIMISEFTYAYVKDMVEVKPLDAIKVKGKETFVMMYEVVGYKR